VEDIVVFLGLKVINPDNLYAFSCSRNAQVTSSFSLAVKLHLYRETTIKNNNL